MQFKYNNHIVDSEKTSTPGTSGCLPTWRVFTLLKLTAPEQQHSTDFANLSRRFKRTGNPASGQRLSCGGCGVTISPGRSTDLLGTLQLRIIHRSISYNC
ncbi:hypothetical protein GQ600_19712 [Phytophthora cactorum]|nr:hypothetical protein GQ600_19712 [Phytophthora cactorum]